jgi:DNA-binding transcriptional LysR family regulator
MSIKKYEAFAKVVETGSLTRAAEELGYTQSGVSHMISAMEEEFGFILLRRSRAGVSLTEDGLRVMPAIRGILNYNEQLRQIVAATHGLDAGTVRVGVFSSVAVHWLPGMIKTFLERYPRIEFTLRNGDYSDVERWLADGSVDLAFVTLPTKLDCRCVPLVQDRLLAVLPKEHSLAASERVAPKALAREPFIGLLAGSNQDARRAMEAAGVKPDIKFTTKDDYAIIAMVEQGLGVSIMPELLLTGRTERVCVMELDPPSKRTIALAVPEETKASPAARNFALHVCHWVQENYGERAEAQCETVR